MFVTSRSPQKVKLVENALFQTESYGITGGYLQVLPKLRTIVFATDKKRIMEGLPAPGINPLIDRYIQGYEGSGITIRPSDGVETLSSAKGIPVSGWYLVAQMSTDEAFAPVHALQKRVLLATLLLTLLSGILTLWLLQLQLAPMRAAAKKLAAMADTDQLPPPLPITRQDEIGELIGGFNRLLETFLNQCVKSTANIVRNEIKYIADLDLQLNEIPLVVCNPQQINQFIANMLVNAGQAMDKHGQAWRHNRDFATGG